MESIYGFLFLSLLFQRYGILAIGIMQYNWFTYMAVHLFFNAIYS